MTVIQSSTSTPYVLQSAGSNYFSTNDATHCNITRYQIVPQSGDTSHLIIDESTGELSVGIT